MNKFRQCIYTTILIITCFIASPFIFKQIWNSSAEKKKVEKLPPITANIPVQNTTPAQTGTPGQPAVTTTVPDEQRQTTVPGNDAVTTDASPEGTTQAATEAPTQAPTEAPKSGSFVQGDASYFDDALFIGDSRTVGIRDYGTLKNADYFCNVGMAAYKMSSESDGGYDFTGKLQSKQYGKVYIMLGINEVGNNFDYTISAYSSVISTVRQYQPNAIIVLMANLHVTAAAETSSISNDRINYLNAALQQFADNQSVFYIDVNPVFDDPDGNLRADATGDGVHVYGNYYPIWCEFLCNNTVSR